MPAVWGAIQLDECIEAGRPICYGILMPGKGLPGGVPVIKVKNIRNGEIDESDLLLTSPEIDKQYARSRVRAGDILLTIRGTTGRTAIVPPSLADANITQDTARLSIRSELSADYIFFSLQSPGLQRQIRDQTRGQAVKGINIGDVRRLLIPLPPRDEQEQLARSFKAILANDVATRASLDALRRTKAALSSALLTGEVRVSPEAAA